MMGDFNLHGITTPEENRGLGLGYMYHCIAMKEIRRASGSFSFIRCTFQPMYQSIGEEWNSSSEAKTFLPKLISGEHVGALAMSEPNARSDVVSMKCKADCADGGYILNGNKMWCTNGPIA